MNKTKGCLIANFATVPENMSTRKPRQARAKVTVDTIIEAGFIAVALHGPSGTTTRHIAEIAGVSVGSLYEYFKTKKKFMMR